MFLLPGKSFFSNLKSNISANSSPNSKFCFNPLVSGPGRFDLGKEMEVENIVGLSL